MRFKRNKPVSYASSAPDPVVVVELGALRKIQPDDCVVVTCSGPVTMDIAEGIKATVRNALGCKVIVLGDGLTIGREMPELDRGTVDDARAAARAQHLELERLDRIMVANDAVQPDRDSADYGMHP